MSSSLLSCSARSNSGNYSIFAFFSIGHASKVAALLMALAMPVGCVDVSPPPSMMTTTCPCLAYYIRHPGPKCSRISYAFAYLLYIPEIALLHPVEGAGQPDACHFILDAGEPYIEFRSGANSYHGRSVIVRLHQVYETETMEQGDLSRSSELSTVKKKGGVQSGATAQAVINKGVDVELLVITQGLPDLLWVRLALERAGISSCEAKKGVEKCLRE